MKNLLNHKNRKSSFLPELVTDEYKIRKTKSDDKFSTVEKWNCPSCSATNISPAISSYTSKRGTNYHYQCGCCNKFRTFVSFA